MNFSCIEKLFKNEPPFRLKQVKKLVFFDLIDDWNEATTLPLDLRDKLNEQCPLGIGSEMSFSKNNETAKALIKLEDGLEIESVLMKHVDKRNTVCISSQVGCPLGCVFCLTGKMGFKRNLSVDEIVEQAVLFARHLKAGKEKVTNIVFMGMGEPFLNYDNVIEAIKVLNDKEGFNLGARSFSISTAGIIEGIDKLADEKLQINLAVSLHAPDSKLRSRIMPIDKKYPLLKVLRAVDAYIAKTKRKVMFEYLMIDGLNDTDEHARKLAKLMKKPLYFVNLISYNPTGDFKPSPKERIKAFREILEEQGIKVGQRYSFGKDIKAACGQLAAKSR